MKEKNIRELAKRMGLITVENMRKYTIPQLVVMVANKVNELIDEVGRFESDVVEVVKTQNENIKYLLDKGLIDDVSKVFDKWIKDGTFDSLINQTALKNINDRVDEINAHLSQAINYIDLADYLKTQDDTTALQTAVDTYLANPHKYDYIRIPKGDYTINSTIVIGTKESQCYPIKIKSDTQFGSGLGVGKKDVKFIRGVDGITLMSSTGHGLSLEGITFDGNNMSGTLLHIQRGFETELVDVTFMNNKGYGLLAQALSNPILERIHAYNCGAVEQPAIKIKGNKNHEYVSNTVVINEMNLERNPYTDLDIAYGEDVDDFCEFVMIDKLHIEGTIDNSTIPTHKTVPHVRIGNVRGLTVSQSFIYGGKGPLVEINRKRNNGYTTDTTGISFSQCYFLGFIKGGVITENTPDTLINCVSGDGLIFNSCIFDTALNSLINIESTFGNNVFIIAPYYKTRTNATTNYLSDQRSTLSPLTLPQPLIIKGKGSRTSVQIEDINGSITMGHPTISSTPYMDFKSSGLSGRDVRLIASGGSSTNETGELNVKCNSNGGFKVNNENVVTTYSGEGVPWKNAKFIGQLYVDTTEYRIYVSVRTGQGASDWKRIDS